MRKNLEARIERLGVQANVELYGWAEDAEEIASLYRKSRICVCMSYSEGGPRFTMEAMACGVPCILSANTGHLDIIADDNCFALDDQRPVTDPNSRTSMWRESQVEQIVEQLEKIYTDRAVAQQRSEVGAAFISNLSWQNQTAVLIDAVSDLL